MGTISDKLTYLNTSKLYLRTFLNFGLDTPLTDEAFRNYYTYLYKAYANSLKDPNTFFSNLPKATNTGTSLDIDHIIEAPMKLSLSPSEVTWSSDDNKFHTTSGENVITISNSDGTKTQSIVINLGTTPFYEEHNAGNSNVSSGARIYYSGNQLFMNLGYGVSATGSTTSTKVSSSFSLPAGTYTLSCMAQKPYTNDDYLRIITGTGTELGNKIKITDTFCSATTTYSESKSSVNVQVRLASGKVLKGDMIWWRLDEGNKAYHWNDPSDIYEFCKLGNAKDEFVFNSTDKKWYLVKNIGKIDSYNGESVGDNYVSSTGTLDTGATVYYELSTPQNILLPFYLQDSLNQLQNAIQSYDTETKVTQTNGDLPFVMTAQTLLEI